MTDKEELNERVENLLNDIDSGKVKLTKYSTKEYLDHVAHLFGVKDA